MKKQIIALALAAAALVSSPASAHNSFIKLTNAILETADTFIADSVDSLDAENGLLLLNLFVDPSLVSMEATIKCIEEIQARKALEPALAQLQSIIQTFVEKYFTSMQKKFNQRKAVPSKEEVKEFAQKLEQKIYELIHYFNQLYYQKLYTHLAQKNTTKLHFIFNEQGIIAAEKRDRSLPMPTVA